MAAPIRTPSSALAKIQDRTREFLVELQDLAGRLEPGGIPEQVNWGHVGTAQVGLDHLAEAIWALRQVAPRERVKS